MASSPQGPGWWQASDGQWYPPESHPNHQPPTAPQPPSAPPQYGQQAPYDQAPPSAPPQYGQQAPYGQAPQYGQPQYGQQAPYGQAPQYGQPQYGQPPVAPTPSSGGKGLLIAGIVVVVLLIAGVIGAVALSGSDDDDQVASTTENTLPGVDDEDQGGRVGDPDESLKDDAPDATAEVEVIGPASGPENEIVSAAIADIERFWTDQYPATYQEPYQPVGGGFYSWSPDEELPPCVDSPDNISDNAFYCGSADVVAWDDTDLIPRLYENYGDLSVAVVFAHEFGHGIQARAGVDGQTVTLEQQADCFAGAWVAHVRDGGSDYFTADGPALDQALAGFIEIADTPGTSAQDPNAHGSAFDRINSFQEGLEGGADTCAQYDDQSVGARLVELEFQTQEDFDRGGDAPYDPFVDEQGVEQPGILDLTTADLEDYWSIVGQQEFGTTWTPLNPAAPFDASSGESPSCGDVETSGYTLFYCATENFIAYDDAGLFRDVYDSLGDFAVAALYGTQYALAAQEQFGISPEGVRDQNLMADCMTGSWAASVFLQNRETAQLSLSPGDFDEAVKVFLTFGSSEEGGSQGTGFDRVTAFRRGVIEGVGACTA